MTKTLLLLAAGLLSFSAHAATWNPLTPTMLSSTTTYVIDGNKRKDITVTVNPGATDGYYAFKADIGNQSPENIEAKIESEFGTMALIGHCDTVCTNSTLANTNGALHIATPGKKFDYLALHFGNGKGATELLFYWTVAIESVTVSGLSSFSNYRAYMSDAGVSVSAVPLPGAALLFLSALGIGAGVQRRRRANTILEAA